jgi:hypothetical protein
MRVREAPISPEKPQIREMFRTGRAPVERKLAVCIGTLPLEPADRAELLVILSSDADERIAARSADSLVGLPPASFVAALARSDAAPQLFHYCARNLLDHAEIAAALVAHLGCPPQILVQAAGHLSDETVGALADNLGLLSVRPELAVVLLTLPSLSRDQRKLLEELSEGAANKEALAEAVKEAEADPEKRQSLLQRLSRMRVIERVQLALKGGREERMALIRDPSRVVQRAVLQSPRLSEQEVEGFASMTSISEEVLRIIANSRIFRKNYSITKNLVTNPKTPLDITLRLLPHIMTPDLKALMMNKNIPETLKTTAVKLWRQRTDSRKH